MFFSLDQMLHFTEIYVTLLFPNLKKYVMATKKVVDTQKKIHVD